MKTGRNEQCPCGSGKKYKKCCLLKEVIPAASMAYSRWRRVEGEVMHKLLAYIPKAYGEEAIVVAWEEYWLWSEEGVPDISQAVELETCFLPWFLFNWMPDSLDFSYKLPSTTIAEDYLQRQGSRLSNLERRYMQVAGQAQFSLFQVLEVTTGTSMILRDLFTQIEIEICERQASKPETQGCVLYTCIVSFDDVSMMFGAAPYFLSARYANYIIDFREDLIKERIAGIKAPFEQNTLKLADDNIRALFLTYCQDINEPPQIQNTDGDPIQPTKITYGLACEGKEVFEALASLSEGNEIRDLMEDAHWSDDGRLIHINFSWLKTGNAKHKSWENTILGQIEITDTTLEIDVNSNNRADLIQQEIKLRLGDKVVYKHAVIQSLDKMMEEHQASGALPDDDQEQLFNTPEAQVMIKQHIKKHYEDWLDTAIPLLEDQSPREAAKSEIGRERLEALLLEIEQNGNRSDRAKLMLPDMKKLRASLGM